MSTASISLRSPKNATPEKVSPARSRRKQVAERHARDLVESESEEESIATSKPKRRTAESSKDGEFLSWEEEQAIKSAILRSVVSHHGSITASTYSCDDGQIDLLERGKLPTKALAESPKLTKKQTTTSSCSDRQTSPVRTSRGVAEHLTTPPSTSAPQAAVLVDAKPPRSYPEDAYPSTESFINFLCLRGSTYMAPELEFFEELVYNQKVELQPETRTKPSKKPIAVHRPAVKQSTAGNELNRVKKRTPEKPKRSSKTPAAKSPNRKGSVTVASKLKKKATKLLSASAEKRRKRISLSSSFTAEESGEPCCSTATVGSSPPKKSQPPKRKSGLFSVGRIPKSPKLNASIRQISAVLDGTSPRQVATKRPSVESSSAPTAVAAIKRKRGRPKLRRSPDKSPVKLHTQKAANSTPRKVKKRASWSGQSDFSTSSSSDAR